METETPEQSQIAVYQGIRGRNLLKVHRGAQPEDMRPDEERQHRPTTGTLLQRLDGGFCRPDRDW